MTKRKASCNCGQLQLTCEGEPVRISICHCLECQKRTGVPFGMQARYARENVARIEGRSRAFTRLGDSGGRVTFHFCPNCGSTVYWELSAYPKVLAVAVGSFPIPHFRHRVIPSMSGGDMAGSISRDFTASSISINSRRPS